MAGGKENVFDAFFQSKEETLESFLLSFAELSPAERALLSLRGEQGYEPVSGPPLEVPPFVDAAQFAAATQAFRVRLQGIEVDGDYCCHPQNTPAMWHHDAAPLCGEGSELEVVVLDESSAVKTCAMTAFLNHGLMGAVPIFSNYVGVENQTGGEKEGETEKEEKMVETCSDDHCADDNLADERKYRGVKVRNDDDLKKGCCKSPEEFHLAACTTAPVLLLDANEPPLKSDDDDSGDDIELPGISTESAPQAQDSLIARCAIVISAVDLQSVEEENDEVQTFALDPYFDYDEDTVGQTARKFPRQRSVLLEGGARRKEKPGLEMTAKRKIALMVVLLYSVIFPGGAYFAWRFIHGTSDRYVAPKGTLAQRGVSIAETFFPRQLAVNQLLLLVTSHNTSESILKDPKVEAFSHHLFQEVENKNGSLYGVVNLVLGYYLLPVVGGVRERFIGGDHTHSTLFQLGLMPSLKITATLPTIMSVIDTWCIENEANFTREYTSTDLILGDASSGILSDLMRVDVISFPLAFFVLALCVKSIRLLLVPAFSLPCTVAIAFSIMYFVSFAMDISSLAPELAVGLTAAVSIDYSLFILTRFREQVIQQEMLLGCSRETEWLVVKKATLMSCENIVVSGLTIAVAVGSLFFVPVEMISGIGLAMSVSVLCAIFVSLTAQPALLLLFYGFFARPPTWRELWEKVKKCFLRCIPNGGRRALSQTTTNATGPVSAVENHDESRSRIEHNCVEGGCESFSETFLDSMTRIEGLSYVSFEAMELKSQASSIWFRMGLFSIRHPFFSILCTLLFGVPFFYFASQLRVDFNVFTQIPRGSPHGEVLRRIQTEIGNGSSIPFYVLFSVRDSYDVSFWSSNEMMNVMQSVIEEIVARTNQSYVSILSPNMLMLPFVNDVVWLDKTMSIFLYYVSQDYRYLVDQTVSLKDKKAAYIVITPQIDSFGALANNYLNIIRDILEKHASDNAIFEYGVTGASSDSWGVMEKSMSLFPLQIGITLSASFLFLLAVMRSVYLPLRMIITVVYTISFSYGVGVIVFQYKWLHQVWGALKEVENFSFFVPIFAFLLLSALALDYDVFLMTRVIEIKKKGYTNEAAIAKAVWKTGPIISFAGLIMFVTIGAMIFSSVMMLAQFAVICGAAVLLDTFVMRPFFSPALMSVVPESFLWWPRRFPELGRGKEDMRLFLDASAYDCKEEQTS